MNSNKPTQNCLIQAKLYKSSELLLWQANLTFTRISSSVAFYFYFISFFLRDVHTFAHLNVLSGCCYRYPHRTQWGGESSNWEKVRKSKWGGDAAEKEGESAYTEWNGENTKRGTIIHLVVSLSRVRECAPSEKEGMMIGEERENELSTCQRIKASSCHILTRSHTHSPQCLNLMSQEPLSGSRIQQHPHTACVIDNLSPCTAAFLFLFSVITTCTLHTVVLPAHWLSPWAKAKSFTYTTP